MGESRQKWRYCDNYDKMRSSVYLCFMIFCWQHLPAQDGLLRQTTDRYAANYMDSVSRFATIYSGESPQPHLSFSLQNHQFFKDVYFTNSRLSYDGVVYPGVMLRWDLYRDELLIFSPARYEIVLKREKIDFAEIHGYHMFYLHLDSLPGCPPAGYYILLFSGEYLLLEKTSKQLLRSNVSMGRDENDFNLSSIFFLQKNGVYHQIKNRGTLLKALDTHRKELNGFIRAHKLKYKKDAEKMVLTVVKEHAKLSVDE